MSETTIIKSYNGSQTRLLLPKVKDVAGVIGDNNSTRLCFRIPKQYDTGWEKYIEFDCYVMRDGAEIKPSYFLSADNSFVIPYEISQSNVGKEVDYNLKFVSIDGTIIEKSELATLYFRDSCNGTDTEPSPYTDVVSQLYSHAHCTVTYSEDATSESGKTVPKLTFTPLSPIGEVDTVTLNMPYLDENGYILNHFINKEIVVEVYRISTPDELTTLTGAQIPDMALLSEGDSSQPYYMDLYILTGAGPTDANNWYLVHTDNPVFKTISVESLTADEVSVDELSADTLVATSISADNLTITDSDLAEKILVTDSQGKVTTDSSLSLEELHTLDGVTGNIQTQINSKAPTSHASSETTYGISTNTEYGHAKASSTSPKMDDGDGAIGSETNTFARGDHVHPTDTSRASQSDFIAHTEDMGNPHGVTKEQVELGSVEDHPMDDTPTNESQNYVTSGGVKSALDDKVDKLGTSPAGTGFVKVNVNEQGQVIGNTSMEESDIPALSISKTTGLQSALDSKQATITGAATTITSSNLTPSRALVSNDSGKVAVSNVTSTELGYVSGVTSGIQDQIEGKAPTNHKSTSDKYGVGSTTEYGHVKVDDNTSTTSTNPIQNKVITEFVNSSINSYAAFYITKDANGSPFATHSELIGTTTFYCGGVVRVPTRNDYAIVVEDENHDGNSTRYIYNEQWEYQYSFNYQFTQAQWNAINSGLSSADGDKLDTIQEGAEVNVQSDWSESDTSSDAFIKNKPAINNGLLTIKQNGTSKGTFSANQSTGTTIDLTDTTYGVATTSANGLMSKDDKSKLDGIQAGAQVNTITGVKGGAESAYRTGNVNVTKANVGLGDVVNTGDSATPVQNGTTKFTTGGAYTELAKKVDKTTTINNHALSGNVTVTKGDVGLGNVDNTSDANKPISTATQNALNNKVDKLSTSPAGNGFVKVNVNAQGQVTGHSAMVEGDIPTLSISKTSGLQSAIDSKLTIPQVVGPGAENNEECYVVTTSTSESLPLPSGVSTGSDHTPIKIVNGTAVAVAHTLMDLDTEQTITANKTHTANVIIKANNISHDTQPAGWSERSYETVIGSDNKRMLHKYVAKRGDNAYATEVISYKNPTTQQDVTKSWGLNVNVNTDDVWLNAPTVPANAPSNALITKEFVQATDGRNNLVHNIADETVDGMKKFSNLSVAIPLQSDTTIPVEPKWKEFGIARAEDNSIIGHLTFARYPDGKTQLEAHVIDSNGTRKVIILARND